MFEYDRYIMPKKDLVFSCSANFAECREKQERRAENGITGVLDYYAEPQKPAETPAELVADTAESKQGDSAQQPISPPENSEIATEGITANDIPFSTENSERTQESAQTKPNISNFANARIF